LTGKATMGDDGDALPLHEFASPAWGPDDEGCRVTEGEVQETVRDSTLFTSRTQGREFEHGEWRAFLAARHLCALPLEPEALLRLLGPADGQPGEIVGHLAPIASWLVDLKPELARGIAEHDPLMLLTAPHPALGAEERALLAETGVNAFTGGWKLSDIGAMQGLANLAHPALTEKLRSLLRVDATPHLQGMACVIARSCPDQAPLDALLTLALHPQADPQSRAWAASLTARLGGEPERHKLVPLCGSDVPEPARTAAVLALWPKHVGTRALLDALSTGVGLIGCLTLARGRIGKDLPAEDMPNAFAWASDALENLPVFATELWVAQAIFRRALVGAEIPQKDIRAAVLPWLGGTAGSIARWESVDWEFWADEEERAFVDALIDAACSLGAPDSGLDTVIDAWGALEGRGLFDRQVGWLVERIAVATDGPERAWLQVAASAALVHLHEDRNASGPTRPSVERRWQAVQKLASDPRARLALGDLLDPGWVPPRSHGPSRAGSDAGLAPDERGNDPWVERIRELLPVEASGGWPEIAWLLQTRPEGRSVELACVDDIPKRPLWRSLRATMQRELRALAASWLRTTTPPQVLDPRFGPTREEGPALWAFGLLASPEAGSGPGASAETLGRWAGVLLRARIPTGREGSLAHVVREAAQIALPQVLAALEDALAGPTFVVLPALDRLELALKLPDVADAVADVAGSLLREGRLQEVHEVFRRLLQAGSGRARDLGIEFMGEHGEGADALDVAAALVEYEPVAAWSVLRERFRDDDRARLMFRRVPAFTARWEWSPRHPIPSSLLGEAFSWLTRLHPYDKGKPRSGVQNGDYVVRMWRDAVIGELRRRTDPDALVAARSLVKAFPQVAFLALVRDEVQRASRDARWRPLSLDEVRRLGRRPPIRDAQELRVAVRAALDEAASALRDKPQPKAEALWNEDRPKPEQALSAWLVAFLRNQAAPGHLPGATVSYDAEQAKPSPVRKGERPDITVQVPLSAGRPPLTCLIEVKPSWADVVGELPVKARYQARTRDTTTIYLVFWFDPAQWNPDRGRKRARNWTSPEALRASLEERAKKLPEDRPVEVVVLDASR
jgi:hypothetical protein